MAAARDLAKSGLLGQMGRLSGSAFADKILIGMGTGAFGSAGSAAINPETWAKGRGVENLFAAAIRGMISGGVTAGVTNAIEDLVPLQKLAAKLPQSATGLRGVIGQHKTIGDVIGNSTNVLGRGIGKGITSSVGAFAGRGAELGFERARGTYKGDAGDIFVSMAEAGGLSFLQSVAEGGVEARAQAIYDKRYGGRPGIEGLPAGLRPPGAPERLPTIDGMPELFAGTRPLAPTPEGPIAEPTPVVRPRGADTPLPEGPLPGARRPAGEAEAAPTPRRPELEPKRPAPLPGEPGVEGPTGIPPRRIAAEPSLADADLAGVPRRALRQPKKRRLCPSRKELRLRFLARGCAC